MPINFHSEKITFKLTNKSRIKSWIESVVKKEKKSIDEVNFIFCSDQYLLQINKQYLKHNYLTDIITFQYDSQDSRLKAQDSGLSGDIFISITRVKENAKSFKVVFDKELHRVMIHGVLHLLGYKDKTKSAKKEMTAKEDSYLKFLLEKSM